MALSNLNLLSENAYFALLYDMIKQRENPWLYNGSGFERIHNGGGDGNPTFGYGFNLAAFSASIVEQVILHAYSNSLTGQQGDGLDLILDWKTGAPVFIDGGTRTLANADIINLADTSLNGAPGAVGNAAQRAAVQSLSLNDAQATRMLDVMIKGDLNLVHIEGPGGSWGYEDGLDYRLAEEGVLPYSVERAALLSVYYNAPSLIGPGVQNAIANDDRPQLWYEIRYNHNHYNHNGLQNRRAEEADLLGLVSQAAKDNPALHIGEFAFALDALFNENDRLGNRILTRIEDRDGLDNFEDAIAPELQALLDYYVLEPLGASSAPVIGYVQADDAGVGETMTAKSMAGEGVSGGATNADTVNLILGYGGNDLIRGLGGADYLYGGAGDDTIYGDGAGTPAGSDGHDLIDGESGDDLLIGGYGDDYIAGGGDNDTINGGAGADELRGEVGNDVINAQGGNDTVYAGFGDDIADGGPGDDYVTGGAGTDALAGGNGDDTVIGGGGDDELTGGAGRDSLVGNNGNDTLWGGNLQDTLRGQNNNDQMHGGGDDDYLAGGNGLDSLNGDNGSDRLFGSGGADTVLGGVGHDYASGGAGNDRVDGGDGADTVIGGGGSDTVLGGAGADSLTGGGGDDTLDGGNLGDTLRGQDGNDFLIGGNGDDLIYGGTGDDTIFGGADNDTLAGNAGDDLFVFNAGEGDDVINGFQAGGATLDVIDLSSFDGVFDSFADILAAASDIGVGTVIDLGGGASLTLSGVSRADLHEDDFIF